MRFQALGTYLRLDVRESTVPNIIGFSDIECFLLKCSDFSTFNIALQQVALVARVWFFLYRPSLHDVHARASSGVGS